MKSAPQANSGLPNGPALVPNANAGGNYGTPLKTETGDVAAPPVLSPEERLAIVEDKIARFENAMIGAAKMMRANSMMSAMMPKEMKKVLDKFFEEHPEA